MDTKGQEITRTTTTRQRVLRTLRRPITEPHRQLIPPLLPRVLSLDPDQRLPQAENVLPVFIGCRQVIIRQVGVCPTEALTFLDTSLVVVALRSFQEPSVRQALIGTATLVRVKQQVAVDKLIIPAAQVREMPTLTVAAQAITGQEVLVLLQGARQEQLGAVAAVQALALTRRAVAATVGLTGAPARVKLPVIQGVVLAVQPVLVHLRGVAAAQAILIMALAPVRRLRRKDVITFQRPAVEVDFIGTLERVPAARLAHQLTQRQAHLVQPVPAPVLRVTIGCRTAADGACRMAQAGVEVLPPILRLLPRPRPNRLRRQPQPRLSLHQLLPRQSRRQLLHLPLPHE